MSQKNKLIILVVGTVLLCIMLIIDCRIFFNGKIQHTIKVDGMEEGIKYTKQRFGENIEKYLLSEHDIGQEYGKKKIAIYYNGYDCDYAKDMEKAMKPLGEKEEYKSKYLFHPQAATGSKFFLSEQAARDFMEFNEICGQFCIINAHRRELVRIDDMNAEKAAKMPEVIEYFKNW